MNFKTVLAKFLLGILLWALFGALIGAFVGYLFSALLFTTTESIIDIDRTVFSDSLFLVGAPIIFGSLIGAFFWSVRGALFGSVIGSIVGVQIFVQAIANFEWSDERAQHFIDQAFGSAFESALSGFVIGAYLGAFIGVLMEILTLAKDRDAILVKAQIVLEASNREKIEKFVVDEIKAIIEFVAKTIYYVSIGTIIAIPVTALIGGIIFIASDKEFFSGAVLGAPFGIVVGIAVGVLIWFRRYL